MRKVKLAHVLVSLIKKVNKSLSVYTNIGRLIEPIETQGPIKKPRLPTKACHDLCVLGMQCYPFYTVIHFVGDENVLLGLGNCAE
jgi:hypothetical protein